jgi:hypothetical protein
MLVLALYLLPWLIALQRGHPNAGSIAVIDIFLGWTFVGWVVALAMACSAIPDAGPRGRKGQGDPYARSSHHPGWY